MVDLTNSYCGHFGLDFTSTDGEMTESGLVQGESTEGKLTKGEPSKAKWTHTNSHNEIE